MDDATLASLASPPTRRRAGALLLGALAASATGIGASRAESAAEHPDEDVRTVDFDWTDRGRDRPVPARLYWPNTASRRGPVPLIVFSHGLGQSRTGYAYLGEHWSSRGVASLHVQHVGSDRSVWLGNPLTLLDRIEAAAQEREAVARARDLSFALDRLLAQEDGAFGARIDPRRVVAAGHSYGANTTLVVGGARVVRDGRLLDHRDPRFRAGIAISAPPFYGERDLKGILRGIAIPTLHVTATDDVICLPGRHSPVTDRLDVFEAVGAPGASPAKSLVVFRGGSHSIFTDRPLTGGAVLNPQVKEATASVVLAFLDLAFRADPRPLRDWTAAWRPILAVAPVPFQAGPERPEARRRAAG